MPLVPSTVKLRYVGGLMHVDIPILDRQGEPLDEHGEGCLVRGEVFQCSKEVAGRPPKLAADGTLKLGDDGQPIDPGAGLLAMLGMFEPAAAPRPKGVRSKNTRRRAKATATPTPTTAGEVADGTEKTEA